MTSISDACTYDTISKSCNGRNTEMWGNDRVVFPISKGVFRILDLATVMVLISSDFYTHSLLQQIYNSINAPSRACSLVIQLFSAVGTILLVYHLTTPTALEISQ